MLDKLKEIEIKYNALAEKLEQPEVYTVPATYAKIAKEQKELQPVVEAYRKYARRKQDMEDALELMADPEMKAMAQDEFEEAKADLEAIEEEIKILHFPDGYASIVL